MRLTTILASLITAIVAFYLSVVPFSKTGLFAIVNDPDAATQAREESLKLIDNVLLKYLFMEMASALAPMLVVMAGCWFVVRWRQGRHSEATVPAVLIAATLLAVSLTGARSMAAMVILTLVVALLLANHFRVNYLLGFGISSVVLVPPTLLTILREGKQLTGATFWKYLNQSIFGRVFEAPMETGLWYVHYAQTVRLMGVGAIPKLGALFGVQPINAPNLIGLTYMENTIRSVNANCSFVFSYYSYFGMASFPVCLLLILLLDSVLIIYRGFSDRILLACLASSSIGAMAFVSADYTTVLSTHGFGAVVLLGLLLDVPLISGAPRRPASSTQVSVGAGVA